ncbi:Type 1 glutamine amidotransferase-like domain-containing protein [Shewanella atlantica]|uniref:Type 1 glutamine amidotransferase-like domain-containing protein n=1 Tax=Shewanella atlantica TaxID=271099 RepID=UPI003735E0E5
MTLALVSDAGSDNGMATIQCVLNSLGLKSPRVAYIASEPDPERCYYRATQEIYHRLGAELCHYVELETDFDAAVADAMFGFDGIHLSGGDTFRFLKWLKKRNLIEPLRKYLSEGGALIGVSAGAMIMTPSIESAWLCGDSNDVRLQDLTALSLVPFQFIPHVDSDIKDGSALLDTLSARYADVNSPSPQRWDKPTAELCFCPDDAGIAVIDGEVIEFGQPVNYRAGS